MRILAIGDFHGTFDKKWKRFIKEEKIDVVVSNGDYFPFLERELWFECCYGVDKEFWEVIGKKKYKEITLKEVSGGDRALKGLNNVSVPVFTVLGNFEQEKGGAPMDVADVTKPRGKQYWKWAYQDFFSPLLNRYGNITRFDYKAVPFGEYILIGMNGHSFPGKVKSKMFRKSRKTLDGLFEKHRQKLKEGKVIFVSHNVPYNTKLDLISSKGAHKSVRGKHLGSKLARRIIERYQPLLFIGGHIHESQGKERIGKTLAINTGSAHEGQAAVIDIKKNGKPRATFIKKL